MLSQDWLCEVLYGQSAIKTFFLSRDRYGEVSEGSDVTNSKFQVLGIKMNVMNFVDM